VSGLAPRAPGDSVRPRCLSGVVFRPLNFAVRLLMKRCQLFGVVVTFVAGVNGEPPPSLPFESVDWAASMKNEPTRA
jgi:hypothetical protein